MSIQGSLQEMNIADLIQHNCAEGKVVRITIQDDARNLSGSIFIEDGEIRHAELGTLEGEEAVYSLLSWEGGTFRQDPDVPAPARTIYRSTTGILLEGMRRIDENTFELKMPEAVEDPPVSGMEPMKAESDESPWSDLLRISMSTEGVEGAVVAAQDGIVLAHDIDANPEKEGAVVVYIGLAATQIEQVLKNCAFQWGRVKISQENILVIGRRDHYLGLFLDERASPALIASQIQEKLE